MSTRPFEPGRDEAAWLEVNTAACEGTIHRASVSIEPSPPLNRSGISKNVAVTIAALATTNTAG